jgi:hypothetical protein
MDIIIILILLIVISLILYFINLNIRKISNDINTIKDIYIEHFITSL